MKLSESKNEAPHVALLIETTRTYSRDLLAGVKDYVSKYGPWSAFVELRSLESEPPGWLSAWRGDGILTRTYSKNLAQAVKASGLPAVELRSPSLCPELPWVGMDNGKIGQMVAEHFLNRGYTNFANYSLEIEPFFRERSENFITELRLKGYECDVLPSEGDGNVTDWEASQSRLCEWLKGLPKPVGVFAANDQLGVRILDACQRIGIAVPEDVAVVGTENEELLCEFATPTLSSVRFNGRKVGYLAAQKLHRLMEGETVEAKTLVEPSGIVVRGSTDDLVLHDPLVRRAVRMLRDRAISGVNVSELCQELKVSRSTLERRMKAVLKRTPKEEALRVQFKEVERLLRDTDLTLEVIAEQTGFSHHEYFQFAFKARYGKTPGAFRKSIQ